MSSPARLARIDFAVATLVLVDADAPASESLPTPGHAPARKIEPDGYLVCDALIARDGVLKYSDGTDEWLEYRPRAELERAANGWLGLPFTDTHPSKMVDARSWSKVAKGTHVAILGIVDIDGVAYVHARLMITDAAIVADIERQAAKGEPVQLSIGFTSEVHDEAGLWMGQAYVAVQRNLIPNHTAKVPAGRAGPACRVLFDGVDCAMYDQGADMIKNEKPKRDDAGSPSAMVQVPDPITGEMISVPSSIAQLMQEYAALKGGAPMPAPPQAAPAMAQPASPSAAMPSANAAPPAPAPAPAAAPAGAPLEKPEDKREAKPDDEQDEKDKDDVKDKDRKESVQALVVARRKLERDAEACGITGEALDGDDVAIKRAIVKAKIPSAKVDALDGVQLDAYVDAALAVKVPAARPWGQADKGARTSKDESARETIDSESARFVAEALACQGY